MSFLPCPALSPATKTAARRAVARLSLACALGVGSAGVPARAAQDDVRQITQWAENEALVEWQVARLAAGCNAIVDTATSAGARREALRLKAAHATSSYAILAGRSPLLQVIDLLAMAELTRQVWVDEGRARREFPGGEQPLVTALDDIHRRVGAHAARHFSPAELAQVGRVVRAWREAHPGALPTEFIRFEAFAGELARSLAVPDLGGLLGRLEGGAYSLEMLGERALFLASRTPRLAQWHAEAAAANIVGQRELTDLLGSLQRLGELRSTVVEQMAGLDRRLAAFPAELVSAAASRPELKTATAQLEQAGQRLERLEATVQNLEKSVSELNRHVAQLSTALQPATLRQLSRDATADAGAQARTLLWQAALALAGLVVLHAALRRRTARPPGSRGADPTGR
ncbi:MAG: hypothetical protein JNL92_02405 [Opitutaceae bacterium]|nr:hypothetical protein [Opitutaceae bacterium]